MKWIAVKDQLPESGKVVLVVLKYSDPVVITCRYMDNLITMDGDYRNIFIIMVHPRFHKTWLLSDEYKKISKIPKSKVSHWISIPELPRLD